MILFVIWVSLTPLILLAMSHAYPEAAVRVIDDAWDALHSLALRWRTHLVQKYGQRAFSGFSQGFRERARDEGYSEEQIREILQELQPEVVDRLGRRYVAEHFGLTLDY